MPAIQITDLSITYDGHKVIDNFSYTFENGSFTALMGESGIGKTSLINAVLGLVPYFGKIDIPDDTLFSVVFQEDRLCEGITAIKNISMTASKNYSLSDLASYTALLNLYPTQKVHTMSGGMKRRVAILRALLSDWNVLILDEPFKGLDDTTKKSVMELVKKTASGRTVILVTHNPDEAAFFNSTLLYL